MRMDHHELMAMVAPRALLVFSNPDDDRLTIGRAMTPDAPRTTSGNRSASATAFASFNGLGIRGLAWDRLSNFPFELGERTLTIAYREDPAMLSKSQHLERSIHCRGVGGSSHQH
ncbi:hypothetical protein [Novipirellula herctigrandis]|uniref:hypothetical protein n=1 Tax=Novipirellula herctigrandis TaxID=2527986 RepID=UPI003AF3BD47